MKFNRRKSIYMIQVFGVCLVALLISGIVWDHNTARADFGFGKDLLKNLGDKVDGLGDGRVKKIIDTATRVLKSFEDITPEQEYYIGRAVAATLLQTYRPLNNEAAQSYINVLGQTLSKASDMPETFGGYHFLILDSHEINAFAAPGGLIFVTRGLLKCCESESMLAAVLAHEIGHVQHKHGLQAIKKSRITSTVTSVGLEHAKSKIDSDLSEITDIFEDSISDIMNTMIKNGYSRSFEKQADRAAVTILSRVGYDARGLVGDAENYANPAEPDRDGFCQNTPVSRKPHCFSLFLFAFILTIREESAASESI